MLFKVIFKGKMEGGRKGCGGGGGGGRAVRVGQKSTKTNQPSTKK